MRTILTAVALAAAMSTSGSAAEITGYVSDDACATKSAASARAADWIKADAFEACVKKCVKDGSRMVFVTEDNKILTFDAASKAKVMPLMGHHVRVTGTARAGTLTVDRIAAIAMTPAK